MCFGAINSLLGVVGRRADLNDKENARLTLLKSAALGRGEERCGGLRGGSNLPPPFVVWASCTVGISAKTSSLH